MLSIDNRYDPGEKRKKLESHLQIIHEPTPEWNYAHHPFLAFFQDRFIITYSLGVNQEDDVGQKVMITSSPDFVHWDTPRELAVPEGPRGVLIPSGPYAGEGRINQYLLQFSYQEQVLRNGRRQRGSAGREDWCFRVLTSEDGEHYTECGKLSRDQFGGNMPVRRLSNGRLFSCGGQHAGWTDDPEGLEGWTGTEIFPDAYPRMRSLEHAQPLLPGEVGDFNLELCEGSFLEYDDGRLLMLLRSGTPHLWASVSEDRGETWSLPEPTAFTDNRTKFFLGRLPDGRYYHVGTPDPFPPRIRQVLALSISEDGKLFDQHYLIEDRQFKGRYPGLDKNGIYGYPTCLVRDGVLYVTCSINKEMICVMHVDLSEV